MKRLQTILIIKLLPSPKSFNIVRLPIIMPVLPSPSDEETQTGTGGITDQVAKNPSSKTPSTASDHPTHHGDRKPPFGGAKAQAQDFQATPGPVIPQDTSALEKPASKEELRARAEELNQ